MPSKITLLNQAENADIYTQSYPYFTPKERKMRSSTPKATHITLLTERKMRSSIPKACSLQPKAKSGQPTADSLKKINKFTH